VELDGGHETYQDDVEDVAAEIEKLLPAPGGG